MDYGNVVKYNVYLDGTLVAESSVPSFTLTGISSGDHTIGLEAVYKNATSERSYYDISTSAIGVVCVEAIPADAHVYNLNGQLLASPLETQPQGLYVVKCGDKAVKVRK